MPGGGAGLFLDMGTGKSFTALSLITYYQFMRTLIVCPKSVVAVWPMEAERHCLKVPTVLTLNKGSMIQRAKELSRALDLAAVRGEQIIVVTNYEAVFREPMAGYLLRSKWDCLVLDEGHRCKSPGGRISMFLSRLADAVPYRLALTGTPLPHSPMDAYGLYRILDKGIFGTSFTNFRARYAIMGGYGHKQVVGYQNQEDFNKKFYSIAYRVRSEDVLSLPDAVDVVRPVVLGDFARKLYDELARNFTAAVADGRITASNALTRLLRLQQVASGWAKQDASIDTGDDGALLPVDTAKQDTLADLLEDCHEQEPIVVFCRFWHDLDAVHTVAAALGRESLELSGRTNQLQDWQDGKAPILAVQIQSGGVGINLVRARYCVFYSLGFSLGEYLQARKRVHRPGQGQSVTYFHLVAQKTVDEQVYKALEARQDVVETILQQVKA